MSKITNWRAEAYKLGCNDGTTETWVVVADGVDSEGNVLCVLLADWLTEDTAHLIAAAPKLADATAGLLGLLQLIANRDDVTAELRDVLNTNHRVVEARAALSRARGEAGDTEVLQVDGSP